MRKTVGANRNIRLTDEQWAIFKERLGIDWLRDQIAKAAKRSPKPEDK